MIRQLKSHTLEELYEIMHTIPSLCNETRKIYKLKVKMQQERMSEFDDHVNAAVHAHQELEDLKSMSPGNELRSLG